MRKLASDLPQCREERALVHLLRTWAFEHLQVVRLHRHEQHAPIEHRAVLVLLLPLLVEEPLRTQPRREVVRCEVVRYVASTH